MKRYKKHNKSQKNTIEFLCMATYNKTIKINAELHSKLKLMSGPNSKHENRRTGNL